MGDFKHADFAENLTEWGKWSQQKSDKSASSQYAAVVKDSPRVSTVRCLTFFCFILQNFSKEPQTITFTLLLYQSVLLTIGRKWQIIRKEFQHVCLTLEISWNDYKWSESHTWDYYGKSCNIMVFLNLSFFPCIKIGNPQY